MNSLRLHIGSVGCSSIPPAQCCQNLSMCGAFAVRAPAGHVRRRRAAVLPPCEVSTRKRRVEFVSRLAGTSSVGQEESDDSKEWNGNGDAWREDAVGRVGKEEYYGDDFDDAYDNDFIDDLWNDGIDHDALLDLLADSDGMADLEQLLLDHGWEESDRALESGIATVRHEPTHESRRSPLEEALLQGVVPADAGVGSASLPGDFGFDPLNLSTTDYFHQLQTFFTRFLPGNNDDTHTEHPHQRTPHHSTPKRPAALILRDYREAEIRHGRLAMLASLIWPLQQIIDRLFIPHSFGSTTVIYGGITLPYLSLFMTLLMLLLGYLDIYAKSIKDSDTGEAFLPGECFWDPLSMLDGAPDSMKRNMQERELNNGRMAMLAVATYILQEALTHKPLITLPWNEFLFKPAFEIPAVQSWLDQQFQGSSTSFSYPDAASVDLSEAWKEVLEEEGQL